ncbi:MAG: hypothetical protein LBQ46_11985 [Treponema sp.]|nr:hypothetical protein [Treponema sp.]
MAIKFLLKLALPVLVLAGCTFLMGPDEPVGENTGTGTLTVSFGEAGGDRAVSSGKDLPAEVLAGLRYEVSFNGPGGVVVNRTVSGSETVSLSLTGGSWRIDASAYYGEALAGTGSLNFELRTGNTSVRVPMYMSGPLYEITIPPTAAGTVASNFNFAFPGTAIALTVTPAHSGAVLKPNTLAVSGGGSPAALAGSGATYTFAMPAADVTVTAEFLNGWRYVNEGASGTGLSWDDASGDLQKMMDEAAAIKAEGAPEAVVRVAAGTYKPQYEPMVPVSPAGPYTYTTNLASRSNTFVLRQGVEVRGGYPAGGGDDSSRNPNPATNNTILSGDIGAANTTADNVYHVVLGVNIDRLTVLDGFTVTGGNANLANNSFTIGGKSIERIKGGGIYLDSASPVLTNVTISGNSTTGTGSSQAGTGGGMYIKSASPVLTNILITDNTANAAYGRGGGICIDNHSAPILIDVIIENNASTQSDGGGMSIENNSSPVLVNVAIRGNTAQYGGGGITTGASSFILINVSITGNKIESSGGGMYFGGSAASYRNKLTNVTIAGNYANSNGGIHSMWDSWLDIRNSVIWGNTTNSLTYPNIAYSIVQDSSYPSTPGADGNMNIDPLFTAPDPATSGGPRTGGAYWLNTGSPAVNRANTAYYPDTWGKWAGLYNNGDIEHPITQDDYTTWVLPALQKDLGGNTRFNGAIDMGAYER